MVSYSPGNTASPNLPDLYGWQSKLALAKTQTAKVLVVGDSIAEGQGASSLSTRWIARTQQKLRDAFNDSAVVGGEWVPPRYVSTPFTSWTRGGTTSFASYGFGFKGLQIDPTGTVTITKNCTSVDLWFRNSGSASTVEIRIDGAVVAASFVTSSSLSVKWNSGALAAGNHTVLVTGLTGPTMFVGSYFYNGDETSGVQLIDGSHSGSRLLNFDTPVTDDWKNHLVSVDIDLMVIECITNDCRLSSSGYSSAQYYSYLTSIITKARAAKSNIPILLLPPYEAWYPLDNQVEPWANYIRALQRAANNTAYCSLIDLSESIPNLSNDPYGLLADSVHPTDRGHSLLSELAFSALTDMVVTR